MANSQVLVSTEGFGDVMIDITHQNVQGEIAAVPEFSRENVIGLAKWLWELDLEKTYRPDHPDFEGAPQETYLLDDLMMILEGGVFTLAYPTDYGKSTLIEMSCVFSLLFWPKSTSNTIVKANEDASVAAARVCWWKLTRASSCFPYARPLTGLRQGNPEVKKGFFIQGSELRTFGGRDPSIYPAGIGDSSLPGRRGRAHFDDLETENVVKSEAKMDTLKKQFNSCVRLIQRSKRMLFLVAGTPQGSNSIMYSIRNDFQSSQIPYKSITRPEFIQEGPHKGKLLWPAAKLKAEIQRQLMDPAAYQIAYGLKPPGSNWYDGESAVEMLKDQTMPFPQNRQEFISWYTGRLYEEITPKVGFIPELRFQADADRMVSTMVAATRFYIGWDPASTGTYSLNLLAFAPGRRFILRSLIEAGTPDEQTFVIKQWRRDFPGLTVVLEADATQLAFASILMHVDPQCPWTPHMTHGYNKDSKQIGIPSMMREFMRGDWKLPWVNDVWGEEYFGPLMREVKRWGPVGHPHGLPACWFVWHFEMAAGGGPIESDNDGQNRIFGVTMQPSMRDPQPSYPGVVRTQSDEAWNRRWPRLR